MVGLIITTTILSLLLMFGVFALVAVTISMNQYEKKIKVILEKMGFESYEDAIEYDLEAEIVQEQHFSKIINQNKLAKIGDKATYFSPYGEMYLEIPIVLNEKSVDGRLRFDIDYTNLPDLPPYDSEDFISQLKLGFKNWISVTDTRITWRGEGVELQLTDKEAEDISNFLRFTLLSQEKQQKIKKILNI